MKALFYLLIGSVLVCPAQADLSSLWPGQCLPKPTYQGHNDSNRLFFKDRDACTDFELNVGCSYCALWSPKATPPGDPNCRWECTNPSREK